MASKVYLAEEMSVATLDIVLQKNPSDSGGELTFHQDLYLSNPQLGW